MSLLLKKKCCCGGQADPCDACSQTPASVTVTFENVTICGGCAVDGSSTPYANATAGTFNATYTITQSAENACEWYKVVETPLSSFTAFYPDQFAGFGCDVKLSDFNLAIRIIRNASAWQVFVILLRADGGFVHNLLMSPVFEGSALTAPGDCGTTQNINNDITSCTDFFGTMRWIGHGGTVTLTPNL